MAQIPIQLLAARANLFTGQGPGVTSGMAPPPSRATAPAGTYLIDAGGISGNALRPGAMDQAQFKTLLAAAQKASEKAPDAGPTPTAQSRSGPQSAPGIPTLTPAQLAALGAIAEPPAVSPATTTSAPVNEIPEASAEIAATQPAPGSTRAPLADQTPERAATPNADATSGPMPRARKGADGVWELPRPPNKDEREALHGQKWRVVEDPEATRLFLGEDGKFGWDDFVDLINPLQHIPLVNIAYRAITGDEINGAARLVDFAFGPVAGVSTALDLAFRDVAGDSMANTAVAALFGSEEGGEALTEYTTAAAIQVADSNRRGSHR